MFHAIRTIVRDMRQTDPRYMTITALIWFANTLFSMSLPWIVARLVGVLEAQWWYDDFWFWLGILGLGYGLHRLSNIAGNMWSNFARNRAEIRRQRYRLDRCLSLPPQALIDVGTGELQNKISRITNAEGDVADAVIDFFAMYVPLLCIAFGIVIFFVPWLGLVIAGLVGGAMLFFHYASTKVKNYTDHINACADQSSKIQIRIIQERLLTLISNKKHDELTLFDQINKDVPITHFRRYPYIFGIHELLGLCFRVIL